jgi:hypothetical protein
MFSLKKFKAITSNHKTILSIINMNPQIDLQKYQFMVQIRVLPLEKYRPFNQLQEIALII